MSSSEPKGNMTQQELAFSGSSDSTLHSSKVLVQIHHTQTRSSNARLIAVWDEAASNWRPIQPALIPLQDSDTKSLTSKYGNPWGLKPQAMALLSSYVRHGNFKIVAKELNRSYRTVANSIVWMKKKMRAKHLPHMIQLYVLWCEEMKRKDL